MIRQSRPAARFESTPAGIQGPAPRLGEHTEQILAEIGLAPSEIADMIASGAASAWNSQP
jgi:crotonobetainyl-CoA:carnitine CoA-transferase CaiB-like acyl-CoA transferase